MRARWRRGLVPIAGDAVGYGNWPESAGSEGGGWATSDNEYYVNCSRLHQSCTIYPMSIREVLGDLTLYGALFLVGILNEASIYQRIPLIPDWGGHLPDSRFWSSILPPSALFILAALVLNWPDRSRRRWLAVVDCGGEGMSPEEITSRASAWILWDWLRMAVTAVAFFASTKALARATKQRNSALAT